MMVFKGLIAGTKHGSFPVKTVGCPHMSRGPYPKVFDGVTRLMYHGVPTFIIRSARK
jgi:hypothetical protein